MIEYAYNMSKEIIIMPIIRPSSELRNNYAGISALCKTGEPVFLTVNGKGDSVLISMDDYDRWLEDIYVREKLREAADDIKHGRVHPFEEVFAELRAENKELIKKAGL